MEVLWPPVPATPRPPGGGVLAVLRPPSGRAPPMNWPLSGAVRRVGRTGRPSAGHTRHALFTRRPRDQVVASPRQSAVRSARAGPIRPRPTALPGPGPPTHSHPSQGRAVVSQLLIPPTRHRDQEYGERSKGCLFPGPFISPFPLRRLLLEPIGLYGWERSARPRGTPYGPRPAVGHLPAHPKCAALGDRGPAGMADRPAATVGDGTPLNWRFSMTGHHISLAIRHLVRERGHRGGPYCSGRMPVHLRAPGSVRAISLPVTDRWATYGPTGPDQPSGREDDSDGRLRRD